MTGIWLFGVAKYFYLGSFDDWLFDVDHYNDLRGYKTIDNWLIRSV